MARNAIVAANRPAEGGLANFRIRAERPNSAGSSSKLDRRAAGAALGRLLGHWSRLSLIHRFALMGGVVMLAAMAVIGSWVSQRIEAGVVRSTGAATALYMDSFIAPLSQELHRSDRLSPQAIKALESIFDATPLGERVVAYKIWKEGGQVVHSSNPELVGRQFGETATLSAAWQGEVTAEFNHPNHAEDTALRGTGQPLLEIYSPIRAAWSDEIIAVAEFYEVAEELQDELFAARLNSWIMVAAVMVSTAALLFGIVLSGSRTIGRQRAALEAQVGDLVRLAEQNQNLRQRMQRASSRVTELNERFLRRISAELHDGPAQLLGFASLRLSGAMGGCPAKPSGETGETRVVREALDQAMQQIRSLCRGLALPDLDGMTLAQAVQRAIEGHRTLTGTEVTLRDRTDATLTLPHSQKICVYRFLNEGLSNAFRHAGGKGQMVTLHQEDGWLKVRVSDSGPGFGRPSAHPDGLSGLGLAGLRERIESLGGRFSALDSVHGGAILTMMLPLTAEGG